MRVAFVHGASVWDGACWRHFAVKLLRGRGGSRTRRRTHPVAARPGRPAASAVLGLPEDVAAVREVLRDGDGPTVVVAHSYRGMPATDDTSTRAAVRLARLSLRVTWQPVRAAAWQQVTSTSLLCTQDRGTAAERQRGLTRWAGRVVELEVGHHPLLSQPSQVRDLVLDL